MLDGFGQVACAHVQHFAVERFLGEPHLAEQTQRSSLLIIRRGSSIVIVIVATTA